MESIEKQFEESSSGFTATMKHPLVAYLSRFIGSKRPVPRPWSIPGWKFLPKNYVTAFVGSFVGITLMSLWDQYGAVTFQQRGIIFSFGATAVLLFAAPESPLSQPRNVVLGNLLSCVVGLCCRYIAVASQDLQWLASALAVSLSIVLMQLTLTLHPPAGATALVAASSTDVLILSQGWFLLLNPVLFGMIVMVCVAVLVDNVFLQFPTYWL